MIIVHHCPEDIIVHHCREDSFASRNRRPGLIRNLGLIVTFTLGERGEPIDQVERASRIPLRRGHPAGRWQRGWARMSA